ncbi:MAG TPA: ankyrin repeat domain-containing protein [Puia sp.]|nr:ankyrin repeat domain-containing protein [Puia sp.]
MSGTKYSKLLGDFEIHSVEGIRQYFAEGGSPNEQHNGIPLFTSLVEMYLRSPRFSDCVRVFIENGLEYDDPALLAVLANDAPALERLIETNLHLVDKTYDRFNNPFTPLTGATLLHFCAEFNHVACGEVLLNYGADVNAPAARDQYGFGGHTPVFHTVCQILNNSESMLHFLLRSSADLSVTVTGLLWGRGYEWETFIPAVNPISYAAMGLLPQMHRDPAIIAKTISTLLHYAYHIDYTLPNVPNAYLKK